MYDICRSAVRKGFVNLFLPLACGSQHKSQDATFIPRRFLWERCLFSHVA